MGPEGSDPIVTIMQFTDYKDYNGLRLPSKQTMSAGGQNIEFIVNSMKINEKLKTKDFIWEE
jgi:hypothetical protein